jgi:uridine kinase
MPFEGRVKQNFDHPDSMDTPLLVEHVRRLREGQAIERPTYDFANFRRADATVRLAPRPAIIIEGILIFENKALRDCDSSAVWCAISVNGDARWKWLSINTWRRYAQCIWSLSSRRNVMPT